MDNNATLGYVELAIQGQPPGKQPHPAECPAATEQMVEEHNKRALTGQIQSGSHPFRFKALAGEFIVQYDFIVIFS